MMSVGRDLWVQAAEDLIQELESSEACMVRWVKGRVGTGKTNFFGRVIEIAHRRNWVTSFIVISGRGEGTELHRFEEIYRAILRHCLSSALIDQEHGRVEPGRRCGWEWILDQWCQGLQRLAGSRTGGDIPFMRMNAVIEQAITSMRRNWSIHGGFAEALRQYARAKVDGDQEWATIILDWFLGEDVLARGGEVRLKLRTAGIREALTRRNAKELLRSLSSFIRYCGYRGILILIDEVENVLHQSRGAREDAYTTLRELIDNADDRHGMTCACFYISGTPDVFESKDGLISYEALASRVLLKAELTQLNPKAAVINLGQLGLNSQEMIQIAERIMDVHAAAQAWVPPANLHEKLETTLNELVQRNPDLTPRDWVKIVVDLLDRECSGKS